MDSRDIDGNDLWLLPSSIYPYCVKFQDRHVKELYDGRTKYKNGKEGLKELICNANNNIEALSKVFDRRLHISGRSSDNHWCDSTIVKPNPCPLQPSYDCGLHHSHSEVESSSRNMACRSTLKRYVPPYRLVNRRAARTLNISGNGALSKAIIISWSPNKFAPCRTRRVVMGDFSLLIPRPRD